MYAQQGWSVQGNVYQANGNLYVTVQQPADSKQGRSKLETWSKRVALVAAVIGIIISLFTLRDKIKETFFVNGSHPTIEIAAKNLADSSPELRTLGSQQLAEVGMKTLKDAEHSISILNTFLHREAAKAQGAQQTQQRADVLDVLRALNGILKNADNKRWVVRKPVLEKLNLSNLDLSNIYLRGVRISETSFEGANLSNADFSGATLVVVRFDRAQAQGAKFIGVTIENSCMEGIDLTKADLSSAAVNNSDINSAILVEATLHEAKLLNTRVADADFRDSDLSSADLSDAREIKRGQLDRAKNVDSAQLPDPLYKQSRLRVCNPLE